jgi:hypothetical protein
MKEMSNKVTESGAAPLEAATGQNDFEKTVFDDVMLIFGFKSNTNHN